MLLTLNIVSFVFAIVCPDFLAEAMLEIVFPLSFVPRAILVDVDSVTVGFVVQPFYLEDIAVNVPELSMAACLVEPPVTFVFGAIFPYLLAITMLHVSEPLPDVGSTVFEVDLSAIFELGLVDVVKVNVLSRIIVSVLKDITSTVAHIVSMLRIHFAKLRSNSFSCYDTSKPCLEPNNDVDMLRKVNLHIKLRKSVYLRAVLGSVSSNHIYDRQ